MPMTQTRNQSILLTHLVYIVIFLMPVQKIYADKPFALNQESTTFNNVTDQRIIGGIPAARGAYPWMTAILARFNDEQFCGGTLIHRDWVLSAAHCFFFESGNQIGPDLIKTLTGQTSLNGTGGEERFVTQIITHPSYNQFDPESPFDIALLRLNRPSTLQPVETLWNFNDLNDPGDIATALGWGTVTVPPTFTPPINLQQVNVPIVSNEVCNNAMGGSITDNVLCAAPAIGGKDTCQGDSGGPLIVFNKQARAWVQAGITSWGISCAEPGFYGVYTRLEKFKDYISNIICSADEVPGTPILEISAVSQVVTARWNRTSNAQGYRLYYAPYPDLHPIYSLDMMNQDSITVALQSGDNFYVAVDAYNHNCRSNYSNIEFFITP